MFSHLPRPFSGRIRPADRDLVVLGSSSSEALDYAIGRHPSYHPFWAGAWSARGLNRPAMQDYLARILDPFRRDTVVLLNFGLADILFNARYKAVNEGFYDFPGLLREAAAAILVTRSALVGRGFATVLPVFLAPVPPLRQAYWQRTGPGRQLPNAVMGRMYRDLHGLIAAECDCLDLFDALSAGEQGAWLLRPEFLRQQVDHHPDYRLMHEALRDMLSGIEGIAPCRDAPLRDLYPYSNTFISALMPEGRTRPSTCRP